MPPPILEIKNLSIGFANSGEVVPALHNISFTVKKGETIALVGESGSGKTVTALSILRLLPSPPAKYLSGEITFNGREDLPLDLLKISDKKIRQIRGNDISMIFQEPMTSLNPVQTVGRQVTEPLMIHRNISRKEADKETVNLFRHVELPDPGQMMGRYPHQLSGGQKQRVMIAMAISCSPGILIADEPTTALDVTVQKTITLLLKKLQIENDMAVIYITHDLALVAEIADRLIVMYKGRIVETGRAKEIFKDPQHPYTQALIKCRPTPNSKGGKLPVISDFLTPSFLGDLNSHKDGEPFAVEAKPIYAKAEKRLEIADTRESLIKVENLKVYFPVKTSFTGKVLREFKAVDGVSFEVKKGETLGLVGESGCGKTTLGRTLIRLIDPTSGNIFFNGTDLANIPNEEMRKLRKDIQIIFQDPYGSLNPRITIGQAIDEPMKIHDIEKNKNLRRDKIIYLLEKVDLKSEHFNRYPHEFSGGQRQRICIARALCLSPDFIICDESVSALDVSVQAQVLNLLNELKAELGFTCIFISHDLGVVYYISDRIMVMQKGKIVETGTAADIFSRPQVLYTRALIKAIPTVAP